MPVIEICMGSSCFSRGNGENLRVIRRYVAEHQLDASVNLVGHLCQDRCSRGPHGLIDGEPLPDPTPQALPLLLAQRLKK